MSVGSILLRLTVAVLLAIACEANYGACRQPQRSGIFSLETLSNRDQITNVFHDVTAKLKQWNATTTIQGQQYKVVNFTAALYYNDYEQIETIKDNYHVNVMSGKLHAAYHCKYSYGNGLSGNLTGRIEADKFMFVKGLQLDEGRLDWFPSTVDDIIFALFSVLDSQPKLPEQQRKRFENMLNNNTAEDVPLKADFISEVNRLYRQALKTNLNSEQLLNTSDFNYTYRGKNITLLNVVSNFSLNNIGFKGLNYTMMFEVKNLQNRCNTLPTTYDSARGGFQEYIAMETVSAMVLYALQQGWLNAQLDRSWETEIFQFYCGDIANVIDQARNRLPNEAVTGECHWNNTQFDFTLNRFSDTQLYASIPYSCSLTAGSTKLQSMYFTLNMEVKPTLKSDRIDTEVSLVGLIRPTFYPEGDYRVTNSQLAAMYILSVAKTLIGRPTFGSGFPSNQRNYPQLEVFRDYLLLYDPSEK